MLPQSSRSPGHLSPGAEAMGWSCFLAHPLQAPGSDWNPALQGLSAQQVRPLIEGTLPPFLRASSPWGLWTFLPPCPPPPPNPGAPWSCPRPHGCHFCLPRVPGEAVLPEGGGWGWASQEAPEGLPAPRQGFRFRGAGGGWSSGRGGGADTRAQSLAWFWSGRGLAPWGSSRPPHPVPVCFCPLPSSCPGPLPTLPCLCWASCLAGPGALLAPRICGLGSGPQLGACSDPALLGPAGLGEWWSPPALLSEGWGSAGREAVRLALGWHFLSPPPPSLAEAGRELVGVPRLPSGGPGRGGRQEGPGGLSGGGSPCSWGLSAGGMPPGPQREPRASCSAMPELAYSSHGELTTSRSGLCLCRGNSF